MRVRTSADSIRNLERLLAFDEAAGSKGMWSNRPGAGTDSTGNATTPDHARDQKQSIEASATNRHSSIPAGPGRGNSAMVNHY